MEQKKLTKIRDEITGIGMIAPAEIKTELYRKVDLLSLLSLLSGDAKIYLYAKDTEGTEYFKSVGNAKNMLMNLEK